jgi:hypothetical protein
MYREKLAVGVKKRTSKTFTGCSKGCKLRKLRKINFED